MRVGKWEIDWREKGRNGEGEREGWGGRDGVTEEGRERGSREKGRRGRERNKEETLVMGRMVAPKKCAHLL
jgi:hypothetical protein